MENSAQTGIDEVHRLWIALFDDESGVLAVTVGSPATNWDEILLAAEPVLESVTIGASPW
jgi:hypothetical protein